MQRFALSNMCWQRPSSPGPSHWGYARSWRPAHRARAQHAQSARKLGMHWSSCPIGSGSSASHSAEAAYLVIALALFLPVACPGINRVIFAVPFITILFFALFVAFYAFVLALPLPLPLPLPLGHGGASISP